ncbi:hypothetical protein VNO77_37543 [Canavalia gladiata]|uniref:Uncharacterized protein n=1 Tax=Canavalia gladiata TaxID=3824 RepID=A0AAN9KBK2_CANGL
MLKIEVSVKENRHSQRRQQRTRVVGFSKNSRSEVVQAFSHVIGYTPFSATSTHEVPRAHDHKIYLAKMIAIMELASPLSQCYFWTSPQAREKQVFEQTHALRSVASSKFIPLASNTPLNILWREPCRFVQALAGVKERMDQATICPCAPGWRGWNYPTRQNRVTFKGRVTPQQRRTWAINEESGNKMGMLNA